MTPMVQVEHFVKHFTVAGSAKPLQAVSDVSFSVERAETLGIVGESGSGKTTVGPLRPAADRAHQRADLDRRRTTSVSALAG